MNKHIFKRTDLLLDVDYDYERSKCHCNDDYCRCTTIERAWVENIDVCSVVDRLYHKYNNTHSCIDKYCFDRICYAFKIFEKDFYEIETFGGYYGEEIEGIYFENEEKIINAYNEMFVLNSTLEKIKYCLKLEYGYLIDCVESSTSADIIEVSPNDIRLPQTEYFIKLENNVIEEYKNRKLPIAVCVRNVDKYRLIDGYHRFAANKERDTVSIIILE